MENFKIGFFILVTISCLVAITFMVNFSVVEEGTTQILIGIEE